MKNISRVILMIWLATAGSSGYLINTLSTQKINTEQSVQIRALSLSRLIAEHASNKFDLTDLILQSAVDQIRSEDMRNLGNLTDFRWQSLEATLKHVQTRSKGIVSMSLTDANGIVYVNTVGLPPGVNLADRSYFIALKGETQHQPVLSEPIFDRLSKTWVIQVARRIQYPDGKFAGMVVANLGVADIFEHFYRSLSTEMYFFIMIHDSRNQILASFPTAEPKLGASLSGPSAKEAVSVGYTERVVRSISPIDGIERFVGSRKLDNYSVFASVGLSTAVALRDWNAQFNTTVLVILAGFVLGLVLTLAIRRRERIARDLEQHRAQLEILTRTDSLTGVANRRFFVEQVQLEFLRANRDGTPLSLLMIDLDHFKRINDKYGHSAGDLVLTSFAHVALVPLRATDLLARVGGEEFLVLLPNTTLDGAIEVALRILSASRQQVVECNNEAVHYTVSIGAASLEQGELSYEAMLNRTDSAMYKAKEGGRDRVYPGDAKNLVRTAFSSIPHVSSPTNLNWLVA